MKTFSLIFAVAAPMMAQQGFDFKTLDKLGANSTNSVNVTLNQSMLKLATSFLGNQKDAESIKPIIRNLKGVYVRTFEYDKAGQYSDADLGPLRTFLKQPQWNKIIETKDAVDTTEIYVQPLPNDQLGGVAIIAKAAKELTVVYIEGLLRTEDIAKFSGNLGIPKLNLPRELR